MNTKATRKKKATRAARGTGRLYKRTKDGKEYPAESKVEGVFWIQYTLNGKRKRHALTGRDGKPITDLRTAETERKRLTAPLRAGKREEQLEALTAALAHAEAETERATEEAAPLIPISQAWNAFIDSEERPDNTGERTLKDYASYFNAFTEWLEETVPEAKDLRDITPQIAQDYAKQIAKGEASPNTFNKHTSFLRLFFRVLGPSAGLKENPFEKIRRKSLKTQGRRELTIAELRDILTTAKGDLQTLLALGTFTGLRLGDCCTLKWGEVDLDRGLIRRIPNKTAKNGKPVLIGIPPTLADVLAIIPAYGAIKEPPIGDSLKERPKPSQADVLAIIPADSRKGYVLRKYAEQYTFINKDGLATKRPDITSEIQTHFTNCGIQIHKEGTGKEAYETALTEWKKNGKNGKEPTYKRAVVEVGFHSLRHTYVSLHAERGTPQALIQGNVGHSNPAMTSHYLHVNEETAIRTAQVLTLDEPKNTARTVPDWIAEKLQGMTAENWEQIKTELIGGAK